MKTITTPYGVLRGVGHAEFWPDKTVRAVIVEEPSELETPFGLLTPRYKTDDLRRLRLDPVEFHKNGRLKSVVLETPVEIETQAGRFPAESLSFHESGALRRLFPLRGNLSGYWTWQNEVKLAKELVVALPYGTVHTRFLSILFHEGGAVRSLTLWPKDTLRAPTPAGTLKVRVGMAFHEDGRIRSVEPAEPVVVETPIGLMTAFDTDPEGLTADVNSLGFTPDGGLGALSTAMDRVTILCPGQPGRVYEPALKGNLCDELVKDVRPLRLAFDVGVVRLAAPSLSDTPGPWDEYDLEECQTRVERDVIKAGQIMYGCFEELA